MESIYTLESFVNFIKIGLSKKSIKEYKHCMMHFLSFLEEKQKISKDFVKSDILEYISILKNKDLSASFIKINFWAIKKYYKYLVKHDAFDRLTFLDIFDDVDLPKTIIKRQSIYLKDDVKKKLEIFDKNKNDIVGYGNYIFLLIITFTGARMSETGQLKVEDIDFNTNHITFYNTKNKKPRAVKMCDCLVHNLLKYLEMRKRVVKDNSEYLFLGKNGRKINVDTIGDRIRYYAKKHGVEISFHPFRRGFATELANRNVPIEKISKILGHSSINVTSAHYIYSNDLDEATLMYNLFDESKITLRGEIQKTKIILQNELQNNTENSIQSQSSILKKITLLNNEVASLVNLLQKPS